MNITINQQPATSTEPPPPYAESSDQQQNHTEQSVSTQQPRQYLPPSRPPPSKQPPLNAHRPDQHIIITPFPLQHQGEEPTLLKSKRQFPVGAVFFLLGWFCPPFWFIGACCCANSPSPYENWWGKLNLILAAMTLLTSVVYSMIAISGGHWDF
ncbi:hypothetical protein [Absidia glauca]|uniref:Uncharacterized protein n=1 Tax=Absidia glauca TaxID=4829 RepID=A0A163MJ11_ABSGL|nr:hypothetical protein [Absidia glauca]